jgi:hypothetical protein
MVTGLNRFTSNQEEPTKQGLTLGYAGVNRKQIQDEMSKLAAILKA